MILTQKSVQKDLAKGLLDLIILQILESHPMHGYELIMTIKKSFGIYFGASTIYPILTNMEKKNYVQSEWNTLSERARKVYKLTNVGKATLDYTTESLNYICRTIAMENPSAPQVDMKQESFEVSQSLRKKEQTYSRSPF